MKNRNTITLIYDDESGLLEAVEKLRGNGEGIVDVLTPFPVHGLDEAMSIRRTRIPIGGFLFGALGAALAFGFQAWVFTKSYPLIIGGKPLLAAPAFIPITFEVTVLFGGLAMAIAFLVRSGLKPEIRFEAIDPGITDDKFVIVVDAGEEGETKAGKIRTLLGEQAPGEIKFNNQEKPE